MIKAKEKFSGNFIYLNPNHIAVIKPKDDGCSVGTVCGKYYLAMSAEEMWKKVEEELK